MRRVELALIGLMTIAGAASGLPARAQATDDVSSHFGVWRNPKDSVHVEIKSCGANACGYVVWANAKAQADARKGGTGNLIGLQILRGFTPEKNGTWRGKVFIPDLNMTFAGTAEFIDATTMKARGCFLANILCKSQTWRRVDAAPG